MGLPREHLDDIAVQRFQDNVGRKIDKKEAAINCLGGDITPLGNNTFSVTHSLAKPVSSFYLLSHATAGSIKTTLVKSDGTTATFSFDHDPGTFTVSLS